MGLFIGLETKVATTAISCTKRLVTMNLFVLRSMNSLQTISRTLLTKKCILIVKEVVT